MFFFSSRRRHTRCGRDWSSDVCSSDLAAEQRHVHVAVARVGGDVGAIAQLLLEEVVAGGADAGGDGHALEVLDGLRSEERRVGKECRSRWSTAHYNKKARVSKSRHD